MTQDERKERILLDHGSGGKISHELITGIVLPEFDNPMLSRLDDGAELRFGDSRLAFSTDTFTVDPIFFPGGDIGDLAINGTVNDVAMCGAVPLYLSSAVIIEEGFPLSDFKKIIRSMAEAARRAGVKIVTGDTKVVPKGAADRIFINTTGVGLIPEGVGPAGHRAAPGDQVLISGTIADHGMTILTRREGMDFDSEIKSDSAALNHMTQKLLSVCPDIHVLRDPTRGGVGTTLNEIAESSGAGVLIHEDKIPVNDNVMGVCELLGFDPLYVANEGKLLAFVDKENAPAVLSEMKKDPLGRDAAIIGEVVDDHPGRVFLKTRIGGLRAVDMLAGEQLPRIC
ncbi:carbamoyl phosphate phosphatase, hydrogenase 3 maturation protein [Candidatus Desulfarcum epimagneticum]|uniref:Carbamoyl phosphate phosphatase, hydrogenase 3 maturation protein n=1 Tax=uncultured Desulfobacteraceae bacterium TaxID=218296 RepID=A0A484HFX9_9BACT|nr:carbamoyl phosphate phosphatase, hydrogenase 3 maturation protein [uncultured Desulfobacteraceae bacterium]